MDTTAHLKFRKAVLILMMIFLVSHLYRFFKMLFPIAEGKMVVMFLVESLCVHVSVC